MVLEIEKKKGPFKTKQIWFASYPHDVKAVDRVIFRDCKNKIAVPGFSRNEFTTLIINLNKSLENIWENMDKSSCRYAIKRAERDGVEARINEDREKFYKININFRKKKGLLIGSSDRLDFIKKNGTLFTAYLDKEIIAGSLFIEDNENMRWLFGASNRLIVDAKKASLIGNANRLIIWEAIKYAKEKGKKEFDFGGYLENSNDKQKMNISLFKKSFGGEIVTRYVYQKDYSVFYTFASRVRSFFKK